MKIVAKSIKGKEFFYSAPTAHKVAERSAKEICDALNGVRYNLKDGEIWHVHDIDCYDGAFEYASNQSFVKRNHRLVRVGY